MGFSLVADYACRTIDEIDLDALQRRGIRLLLADLDNTLVAYGVAEATPELHRWREKIEGHDIQLFVLSNNRHPERAKIFANSLRVPYIGHAGKPKTPSFIKAMGEMGVTREQTAIVGDQIFTDILGGNRSDVTTILVEPIKLSGNIGRYFRYAGEYPFRCMAKKVLK